MTVTVPLSYAVQPESGLVTYPLGGVVKSTDMHALKGNVTHAYAWGQLRSIGWTPQTAHTVASTSYESLGRSTWRFTGERRKITIKGYGDTVTLRVRVYEDDGTTLLATSEDASGTPGAINGSITSGITQADVIVDVSVKCTSGTNQTLNNYALLEQPLVEADLP